MLTDQSLRGYEKYVMSERNLEETLNILPTNSEDYLFLKLIHILHSQAVSTFTSDKDVKAAFELLKDRYHSDRAQMVVLREALLRFDSSAEGSDERNSALNKLKDYCYWNHDYTKPSNLKKIKKRDEDVKMAGAGDDDTSEEEDEELRKYDSKYDSSQDFNRNSLCDSLISSNSAANIHAVSF